MLCTIMSTTMPASASSSNVWAARPGMSGRPTNVTRDCDSSRSIPSMISFSMRCSRATSLAALGCGETASGDASAGRAVRRRNVQLERLVDRPQGLLGVSRATSTEILISLVRDHLDVDALFGQGAEHRAGHAGLGGHAQADDGNLRHVLVVGVAFGAEFLDGLVNGPQRGGQVVAKAR